MSQLLKALISAGIPHSTAVSADKVVLQTDADGNLSPGAAEVIRGAASSIRQTINVFGDSINQCNLRDGFGPDTYTPFSGMLVLDLAWENSTSTNGTVRWYASAKQLTWQPGGGAEGRPIAVNYSGCYALPGDVEGKYIRVNVQRDLLPTSNSSFAVRAKASETWGFSRTNARGPMAWAVARAKQAWDLRVYAASGARSDHIAEQIERAYAEQNASSALNVYFAGANDLLAATLDIARWKTAADKSLSLLKNAGVPFLVIPPRMTAGGTSSTPLASNKQLALFEMTRYLRVAAAGIPNAIFCPGPANRYIHETDTTLPRVGYTYDGTHSTVTGAFSDGKELYSIIKDVLGEPGDIDWGGPGDVYDATNNPGGNLLGTPFMSGTAGTNGTGSSGASGVATNWTSKMASRVGGSIVASLVARTDGPAGSWQRQVMTCTDNGEGFVLERASVAVSGAGKWLQAIYGLNVSSPTLLRQVSPCIFLKDGANAVQAVSQGLAAEDQAASGYTIPNESFNIAVATAPIRLNASTATVVTNMQAYTLASGGATVDTGRVTLRYVEKPWYVPAV